MTTDLLAIAKSSKVSRYNDGHTVQDMYARGFRKCLVTRHNGARRWAVACGWKDDASISRINIREHSTLTSALFAVGSWLEG